MNRSSFLHISGNAEKMCRQRIRSVRQEYVSPALTTVGQDLYEMGTAATRMLIAQIEGKELKQTYLNIDAQLIVRGTTRKEAAK